MRFERSSNYESKTPAKLNISGDRGEPEIRNLIDALREELAAYGTMLVLLNRQQKFIVSRRASALLENAGTIGLQIQALAHARELRQRLCRKFAEAIGDPNVGSFGQIISLAPDEHRLLLRALVGEINCILFHCQQRLLQNKLLLGAPPTRETSSPEFGKVVFFGLN